MLSLDAVTGHPLASFSLLWHCLPQAFTTGLCSSATVYGPFPTSIAAVVTKKKKKKPCFYRKCCNLPLLLAFSPPASISSGSVCQSSPPAFVFYFQTQASKNFHLEF